jgi:hypothetical protein
VLQHALDAPAIMREIVRLTKPRGRVVVADTDWATLSIDTPEVALERAFVRFIGESLCNGYAGRQLWRLFNDEGLTDIGIEIWPIVWTDYSIFCATSLSLPDLDRRAVQAGALSAKALARFRESLLEADRRGAFFASGSVVVVHGLAAPCLTGQRNMPSNFAWRRQEPGSHADASRWRNKR